MQHFSAIRSFLADSSHANEAHGKMNAVFRFVRVKVTENTR